MRAWGIGLLVVLGSVLGGCDCGGGGDGSPTDSGMGGGDTGSGGDDAGPGEDAGPRDAGGMVDAGAPDAFVPPPPMCTEEMPCSWGEVMPSDSPPVLAWAAMAYDAARDRIILFGGAASIVGGPVSDRTWSWNGTTWEELFPTRRPPGRWTHGMAYDSARERIVLFGGLASDAVGSGLDDTWEWDGTNWTEVTTMNAPSPRGIHGSIAYDSGRGVVVIHGGGTFPGQPLFDDTWEYDGSDWTPGGTGGPSARVAPALVYDPARSQTLFFGGGQWSPYYGDTWSYDAGGWMMLDPADAPGARQSARAIFDPTRNLVVLFGGDDGSLLNDLWAWDGTNWESVPVAGPPPRCCYAYAHDTTRSQTVLFGGPDATTWVYGR